MFEDLSVSSFLSSLLDFTSFNPYITIFVLVLLLCYYYGLLDKVVIIETTFGPNYYIFKRFQGNYQKISKQFHEVSQKASGVF